MNAWTGTGWTIEGDELCAPGAARWEIERGETGNGLIVVARIAALDLTAGALSIALDGDGLNAGVTCTLERGAQLVARELGGSMSVANVPSLDPSHARSLVAWRRVTTVANELECRIDQGTSKTETSIVLTDDTFIGSYALGSSGASGSLSSRAARYRR